MPNINITVAGKIATNTTPGEVIICGNGDYNIILDLDSEWAAETVKTARFVYAQAGVLRHMEVVFTGLTVAVPVLTDVQEVYVGIYTDNVRTTTPARILCDRSILCGGGIHTDPPEDVYLQILELFNNGIVTVLQPNFANSIEECTDTTKLYVLPDGYIYAYRLTRTTVESGANILPTLTPIPGLTANDTGLYYGYYVSTSSPFYITDSNCTITGMIPYTADNHPVLYIKGVYWDSSSSHSRVLLLKSNGAAAQDSFNLSAISANFTVTELDTNYYKMECTNAAMLDTGVSIITHIGLSFDNTSGTEDIVVSYDPIEKTVIEGYQWANTGRAFVPADYEDRILDLEAEVSGLTSRVTELEAGAGDADGAPAYVQEEAERVADLVQSKRTAQSLVFAALSDIHYPYDDASDGAATTAQAMRHTGMGIAQIRKHLPLDFVGLFGDYVAGGGSSTIAESKAALKFVHKAMYSAGLGVPQIWMQGNHDRNPYDTDDGDLTPDELYAYIGANNAEAVVDGDNVERIYGYRDFEAQKIRVIYFNSSDISGATTVSDHMFSAAQLRWMAGVAFDLSEKEDPTAWGIVVLSHMPLNWGSTPLNLVDAYISGTSGTIKATEGESVAYDFTGANRAEVICCINGHTHNFRASQIGANNVWQIAVPQVCAGRYNEYATSWPEVGGELDEDGNPVYYYKTANSAESTSFCIFVVDRKNRKVHAVHYGAGIDREFSY